MASKSLLNIRTTLEHIRHELDSLDSSDLEELTEIVGLTQNTTLIDAANELLTFLETDGLELIETIDGIIEANENIEGADE